ncbi:MAG: hypothetical protein QXD66_07015 [Candidatus Nezhaarchaeales archaeon]
MSGRAVIKDYFEFRGLERSILPVVVVLCIKRAIINLVNLENMKV